MTFLPDPLNSPIESGVNSISGLMRLICRPQQWWLLEQEPRVWQLPSNSLLHWALMGRDSSPQYQLQSLQQLVQWDTAGQLVAPPLVTDLPGWPLLWRHWIAQGTTEGWLEVRPLKGYWSLWQVLSPDATPLLQALGFSARLHSLAKTRWASVFLLSNGYQHFLLDCAGGHDATGLCIVADQRFCCLFKLCMHIPELAFALTNEAQTLQVLDVLFFQMVTSEVVTPKAAASVHSIGFTEIPCQLRHGGSLSNSDFPLSYQQISRLASRKPWLLRWLPLSPAMSVYRLALCRYLPWLYRQLWPSQNTFTLLQQWILQHRLQRPFVKANFFEAAFLAAIADGLPLCFEQGCVKYLDQQHEARSALSLFEAQRNSAEAGKSFMLADLPALTQEWLLQSEAKIIPELAKPNLTKRRRTTAVKTRAASQSGATLQPLPPLLEQLKVLFLMLKSMRTPQLRQLIELCPWLLLLLPEARQQRFIESALFSAPAMAVLIFRQLSAKQRMLAFRLSPQVVSQAGLSLTEREYHQVVAVHPSLALQFPAFATTGQLVRAVAEQPELFARLRPEQLTQPLLEQLFTLRGDLLAELPMSRRSFKLCHLAITQQLTALAYVPDDFDRRLCQQESYWEFYQQCYQFAKRCQPQLGVLMQQKLPEFCRLYLSEIFIDSDDDGIHQR